MVGVIRNKSENVLSVVTWSPIFLCICSGHKRDGRKKDMILCVV